MEHNAGQGRNGKGKTQRLVRAAVRTAAQDERMTQERMAGQGARQGGGHGKGAEHGDGQVKWQSRADRRTQIKCEIE